MITRRFEAQDIAGICRLITLDHVFNHIDTPLNTLYGIHCLLKGMEQEQIKTYVAEENGNVKGVVFGRIDADNFFESHVMFDRHVDALQSCNDVIKDLKARFDINGIICYLPESNRAAKMLAKKLGMAFCGFSKLDDRVFGCYKKEV